MNVMFRRSALIAALPLLVAVACGDDDPTAATTPPSTTVAATTTTAAPAAPAPTTVAVAPSTQAPTTQPATTQPVAPGSPVDVEMRLLAFRPEQLSVAAGQTIRWTQSDAGFHTITSGTVEQSGGTVTTSPDGRFDSGQLATDATFELTLTEPGSYPYYCAVHPATMHGVVDVT